MADNLAKRLQAELASQGALAPPVRRTRPPRAPKDDRKLVLIREVNVSPSVDTKIRKLAEAENRSWAAMARQIIDHGLATFEAQQVQR